MPLNSLYRIELYVSQVCYNSFAGLYRREREREGQTDRQTDRQTETERERESTWD